MRFCDYKEMENEKIITAKNLRKNFGENEILKDISFCVKKGEVLGIIGPSGSGKSTILRCLAQLEKVSGGSINICGSDLVKDGIYCENAPRRSGKTRARMAFENESFRKRKVVSLRTFGRSATAREHSALLGDESRSAGFRRANERARS